MATAFVFLGLVIFWTSHTLDSLDVGGKFWLSIVATVTILLGLFNMNGFFDWFSLQ